jgi:hypothetical protein
MSKHTFIFFFSVMQFPFSQAASVAIPGLPSDGFAGDFFAPPQLPIATSFELGWAQIWHSEVVRNRRQPGRGQVPGSCWHFLFLYFLKSSVSVS